MSLIKLDSKKLVGFSSEGRKTNTEKGGMPKKTK